MNKKKKEEPKEKYYVTISPYSHKIRTSGCETEDDMIALINRLLRKGYSKDDIHVFYGKCVLFTTTETVEDIKII